MAAFCAVIFLGAEGKTAIAQVPAAENGGATSLIKESLQLRVGQSMFVNTPDRLRRVYVSNPDVLDSVTSNPHQIVVTAKTPGNATLILWDESGQSQAYQVAVNLDSDALRTALKNALPQDNVQVEVQRDQIALSGTVANQAAADEAVKLAGNFS
ncbi:MAG TPA: pilus assembly protein N-terminal domain-containing protein, partial [Acidobacteriaceae bacterium]|nr:pilus assembly protein N-terminal domain-containing protein [Acidobacteriaceae bacterium]